MSTGVPYFVAFGGELQERFEVRSPGGGSAVAPQGLEASRKSVEIQLLQDLKQIEVCWNPIPVNSRMASSR